MKLITAPDGTVISMYASAKECPAKRYSAFQKHLLLMVGVGSDIESVASHFTKLYGFAAEGMTEEIKRECENLHYSFFSVLNGIDFTSLAFSCLIHTIGAELAADLSNEGLQRTSDRLSETGLSMAEIEGAVDEIKKKISEELRQFFPRLFPESDEWSYFEKIKQKLMITGELLLSDKEDIGAVARLKEINRFFLQQGKPLCFSNDADNCLLDIDRGFGALCAMLDSNGAANSQELPLFDFYARIEYMSRPGTKN